MKSKSKTKGKSWERDVCNFLSGLYRDSFIRVPNSGAYVGGKNEYRRDYLTEEQIKLSRGDIIPPRNFPYFLAECKNYADFPFHLLLAKTTIAQLDNWIEQVEHDVTSDDDLWLLLRLQEKEHMFYLIVTYMILMFIVIYQQIYHMVRSTEIIGLLK